MHNSLAGRVAIVTGASSGIGRATAQALAGSGVKLALAARSHDKLAALAAELGPDALALPTDVTRETDVAELVRATREHFGAIDILFANAGVYVAGEVPEGDPTEWANLIEVNVTGVLRCVHAALPHMIDNGSGDILITSSVSGHQAIEWEPVYSASKHAIRSFVHGLRRQLAPRGIRVGAIAPGMVANELWGLTDERRIDEHVRQGTALRSEDIAEIVLFMLSRPRHVTIRDLVVLPHNQEI